MKRIIIKESETNIRSIKFLMKLFKNCSTSLIYKLVRKNYFKINNKKLKGDELLKNGDVISIFLSDETYDSLKNNAKKNMNYNFDINDIKNKIVYEDENLIVYNKNEGELSQKGDKNNITINEKLNYYLYKNNIYNELYNPSVVNRLDINTKGLIMFAKTYIAANVLSKLLKERRIKKYYFTYVNGKLKKSKDKLYGVYKKDTINNKAYIDNICKINNDDEYVITEYEVLKIFSNYSAVNINLITGKSHQIRAHFSSIAHPLICDKKYMDNELFIKNKKQFKRSYQDLMCYKIVLPNDCELDKIGLSNKEFLINYGDIDKYEKV